MPEVKMPQLGETVVEGTITKWLKNEGDMVEEDDLLVEISTDKVDSEVPSSHSGKLTKILVQEGETVSVGTALAVIGDEGEAGGDQQEDAAEPEAKAEEAPEPEQKAEKEESRAEAPPPPAPKEEGGREPEKKAVGESPRPAAEQERKAQPSGDTSKRGIISPLVRRLAEENDVNLDEVEGTGTGGRIRKQDVLRFVEERKSRPAEKREAAPAAAEARDAAPAAAPAARAAGDREELIPWSNIRRRTAEHMVASARTVARAWNAVEVDWTNVVKLREQVKGSFKEQEGVNLTYMAFLAKVVCDTLREMPEVNATFDEGNQANLVKHYVNLGVAVALDGGGLIVPVVKDADSMNIPGLARAITDVATRARNKKLSPDDLSGGTFTITNPGPFGSKISVPIIPQNQTAILAFEAIDKQVIVTDDDQLAIRSMGYLPLSWDHRVIDGAEAAKFLARLRERIETTDFSSDLSRYL